MSNISTRLKAADPQALASRFAPPTPRAPAGAPATAAPKSTQARADDALLQHLHNQVRESLTLRDDMWAPATPVVFTPAPMKPRGSLLDMLLN
jgi:hypothetical protein